MKSYAGEKTRTFLFRLEDGDILPDVLADALAAAGVATGWVRATGVLCDVELRAYDASTGSLGGTRHLAGPLLAVSLDGVVGMVEGHPSVALRGVLARDGEAGLETFAGEVVHARTAGLDAIVTSMDDVAVGLCLDARSGVTLIDSGAPGGEPRREPARRTPTEPRHEPAWTQAINASANADPLRPATPRPIENAPIPPRPVRPAPPEGELLFPEAGDVVEHFAFGRCEVLKSDGDRLHLRVGKDAHVREIALEMLKVVEQPTEGPHRRFKLLRKM